MAVTQTIRAVESKMPRVVTRLRFLLSWRFLRAKVVMKLVVMG